MYFDMIKSSLEASYTTRPPWAGLQGGDTKENIKLLQNFVLRP